jgi:hypothetical protein
MPLKKRANKDGPLSMQESSGNVSRTPPKKTSLPKRSRASLRAKVLSALRNPRKQNWSSRKLAEDQGCSHTHVEKLRAELRNGWLRFDENDREIFAKGYRSVPAYWKSVERLAATSAQGAVQSTSSIVYWYAREKELLETLKKRLSAVSSTLDQEQQILANRVMAVKGGIRQVEAVLRRLKSFPIPIPDAIMRDLAEQKRAQKQPEHKRSAAKRVSTTPPRKK